MMATSLFDGRLAVIGGGKMGEAIIAGILSAGAFEPNRVTVAEPVVKRRDELAERFAIQVTETASQAVDGADMVIIAVKPQGVDTVVTGLSGLLGDAVLVSIAAGISCARLESLLPEGTAVVRVMPNTPAMVREGMALVSGGLAATHAQVELVAALFRVIGSAVVLDERFQDAGTALSGSGPAYFALVIDAMARAGVSQGLTRDVAQELAVQTMKGTAVMLQVTGIHPEELIDGVSSPGGTTIAAITALEEHGVRAAFSHAVSAAVLRSRELGTGS